MAQLFEPTIYDYLSDSWETLFLVPFLRCLPRLGVVSRGVALASGQADGPMQMGVVQPIQAQVQLL